MPLKDLKPSGAVIRKQTFPKPHSVQMKFDPLALRTEARVSLREAAKEFGVSWCSLNRLERGFPPDLTTALKAARFYGKPIEQMWTLTDKKEENPT